MAGTTEVLTNALNEVATSVEELTSRYRQTVIRMYNIGSDIDSMWDGEANRRFMAQLGSDRERFDAMATLMDNYVLTLRNSASTYVRTEGEVLNVLNTNTIRRS
jgi:uncharacterized protein YukE